MDFLHVYLFIGIIAHKLVWEVLKRDGPTQAVPDLPLRTRLIKFVKVTILLGIAVQPFLPNPVPIAADPTMLRISGAVIYTIGLLVAISARLELGKNWSDIETAGVLKEQIVVSGGVYGFIRHPIYTGDLLLLTGLELALNSWLLALVILLIPVVLRQAIREEEVLTAKLPGYSAYCQRTKRFVPFLA